MTRARKHRPALTLLAGLLLASLLMPAQAEAATCTFVANSSAFSVSGIFGLPQTIYWSVFSTPGGLQVDVWGTDPPPKPSPIAVFNIGTTQYAAPPYTFTSADIGSYTRFAKVDAGGPNECTTTTQSFAVLG